MSKKEKIQKRDIIIAAFEILREKGIEKLTVRDIAKKLHCSIQPVFYKFNSMEDLKKELLEYSLTYYNDLLFQFKNEESKYKEIGINYINFARNESNIFKFIFMGDYDIKIEEMAYFDKSYEEVEKILQKQNDISMKIVKRFHLKMWMFTHGIACLLATHTVEFSDKEISDLLTEEFQALLYSVNEV